MTPIPTSSSPIFDLWAEQITILLQTERTIHGNDQWFTLDDILAKLGLPSPNRMILLHAFSRLPFDQLEIDEEQAALRHRH